MSKTIADMYVPGVAFPSLTANTGPEAGAIERWRSVLTLVANGLEHPDAPGLAQRLPAPVRARLGAALGTGTPAAATLAFLGEERVTDRHFNLDPAVVALRRYRTSTSTARRYLTLRMSAAGRLLGVVIED